MERNFSPEAAFTQKLTNASEFAGDITRVPEDHAERVSVAAGLLKLMDAVEHYEGK